MPTPQTTTGVRLQPVSHVVTMENMVLFEPVDEKNIHTDDEVARAAGLPAAIAAGVQFMSYILDMLQGEYGSESVPGTVLDVRIKSPVFAGDTVTARGQVATANDGLVLVDVWCENQRGEQVISGTAVVPLAPA